MTCLNQHWISYKPLSKRQFKPYENPTLINGENIQTTINNTKHPQYNHTLPHNIPSQTIFDLNTMTLLGETNTQTISNSRLTFIFPNRSIIHNQTCVYF